jgi:hypothetical protein
MSCQHHGLVSFRLSAAWQRCCCSVCFSNRQYWLVLLDLPAV